MNRYEDTHHPNNPPNGLGRPTTGRSTALYGLIGLIVVVVVLAGVVGAFWKAAHPSEPGEMEERANATAVAGYSMEGGHNPVPHHRSTSSELKFRGELTPPNAGER
jgi:hypothetical protein